MAYYLVRATPTGDLSELREQLDKEEIIIMQPFGQTLHHSLSNARRQPDGSWIWEEEDYCRPSLAMEREAVLDDYFGDITVETVNRDEGWARIEDLPSAWE